MTSTLTSAAPSVDTAITTPASATIAGQTTGFLPMYRDGNTTPVVFTAVVHLPLSVDDLVAAVWVVARECDLAEIPLDPSDPYGLHALAMDAIVGNNFAVTNALARIPQIRAGSQDYALLCQVRAVVAQAFPVASPTGTPAPPNVDTVSADTDTLSANRDAVSVVEPITPNSVSSQTVPPTGPTTRAVDPRVRTAGRSRTRAGAR